MSANLLEGVPVAEAIFADLSERIRVLRSRGRVPGLGTILVGEDPASISYVRKKHEACERLGIRSIHETVPADTSQRMLLEAVLRMNERDDVDAFIIQNPVPNGFDFNAALELMDPHKDADGLHPVNLGRLVLQEPGPVPCTPAGIQAILAHYKISIAGREVVIVGRGPTLGRPLALLLSMKSPQANAAVTVVHTGVPELQRHVMRAEIVVAAAGVPSIVTKEMVRPGAAVISGGISWQGKRLLPDVDEAVAEVAGWITPRLGGVGPTTVAMLLRNTIHAAETRAAL